MARRQEFGPNSLRPMQQKSPWAILVAQFNSVIVWLLAAAATLSFSFGQWTEGAAILVVLVINSAIGFTMETKAIRSMEALRSLTKIRAKVLRHGNIQMIPAEDIVPGDIVLLESGDAVPADLRLIESANLQCDESALTGESVPVYKDVEVVQAEAVLADRINMAFKGTSITMGSGLGVAVATGMATELGAIAALVETAEGEISPLEKRLDRLGGRLVWGTLILTAFIAVSGILAGHDVIIMMKTAVALAVAAVPEGLPIVATIALARGMWRMAQRNALIENLSAVETLGATTIILTDKTGTLTENRMTAVRLYTAEGDVKIGPGFKRDGKNADLGQDSPLGTALRIAVLCNNASLSDHPVDATEAKHVGDPMEIALLAAGRDAGINRSDALGEAPEVREEAFNSKTLMMATFHKVKGGVLVAVKGAPEAVIRHSAKILTAKGLQPLNEAERALWIRRNEEMTSEGLRVIALAMRHAKAEKSDPYDDLTLLGLIGFLDPARPDVADAVAACHAAGVRVVMVTGDHAGTAKAIAAEVGLANGDAILIEDGQLQDLDKLTEQERQHILKATIFARVSPKTKLNLVALYQKAGEIVAMTGDGVNDAPALKKADIGIAMGLRGTDVAREAADMVLRDDAFPSIVAAMHQGRVIFGNIRKFVVYLMSCNLSEIMVIGLATLMGLPLPLLPLQILYLNLVTDVFPAFALGVGEGDINIMRHPPRNPKEPMLGLPRWISIGVYAGFITAGTLGAFILALKVFGMSKDVALTISFLTLATGQLVHVFNMRAPGANFLKNEVTENPLIWAALALCVVLIAAAVYLPGLSEIMGMTPPDFTGWMLVIGGSLMPLILGPLARLVRVK